MIMEVDCDLNEVMGRSEHAYSLSQIGIGFA